ncbi:HNH endonuclease [Gloeobacter kilaueensis]|uniref:HNH endonuclease n=1 Tax=Gloeobacter kilaueensis (strain ATCC BAA-2537 / CCAP 1431/1 / ULC 316 / JS1) TaxID=1183438 RepID=U5QIK4_GLOK1|nr:HNH endonuclease [Gloeobacter kilaueensis JS1]
MHIEHIVPVSKGGPDDLGNLCLSCSWCNLSKAAKIDEKDPQTENTERLFHPVEQVWSEHFEWKLEDKATIVGRTPTGRATVAALKMNRTEALTVRRNWLEAGWYPPP